MSFSVEYRNNQLYMEGVSIKDVAQAVGTPCYLYSYQSIRNNFEAYKNAFSDLQPIICYSTKANSNISILKSFSNFGSGFDIVSGGELKRVLLASGDPSKIVFSGVGKTNEEIKEAIDANILFFNVESNEELNAINRVAIDIGKSAPIALRVNPNIDPKTHPYISTGFKKSKFGIEISRAIESYKEASKMEGVDVVAIDAHIGSQIFDLSSFTDSVKKLVDLAQTLKNEGVDIKYIDIGGGLAISYKKDDTPPDVSEYADVISKELEGTDLKLVLEPGRSMIGNSGIMITRVLYKKEGTAKKFVIVDAAMNDLIRPAFYDSFHEIITLEKNEKANNEVVDIVGPICESGDFLAQDRELQITEKGDYLAVLSAGAYGFVMSSNYNTRPKAAEVLVSGNEFHIIKDRENFDDLIRGEKIPEFLT